MRSEQPEQTTMGFTEPHPLRWTSEDYYKLCQCEWFQGRRVELINGEIIEMPAQRNVHAAAMALVLAELQKVFQTGYWIRIQNTLDLSPHSTPDPDFAVIRGNPRQHATSNPTSALLVIEISDTSLGYDRNAKSSLYAAANIADYWIVNIPDKQLEVYRDPVQDSAKPFGWRYDTRTILIAGDHVAPLALSSARIPVADLLP